MRFRFSSWITDEKSFARKPSLLSLRPGKPVPRLVIIWILKRRLYGAGHRPSTVAGLFKVTCCDYEGRVFLR